MLSSKLANHFTLCWEFCMPAKEKLALVGLFLIMNNCHPTMIFNLIYAVSICLRFEVSYLGQELLCVLHNVTLLAHRSSSSR